MSNMGMSSAVICSFVQFHRRMAIVVLTDSRKIKKVSTVIIIYIKPSSHCLTALIFLSLSPPLLPMASLPSTSTEPAQTHGSEIDIPLSRASSPTVTSPKRSSVSVNTQFQHGPRGPDLDEKGLDKYEVRFEQNDPDSPFSMSRARRWYITLVGATLVLNACVSLLVFSIFIFYSTYPAAHLQAPHRQASCLR
jgi:hypothetical protein